MPVDEDDYDVLHTDRQSKDSNTDREFLPVEKTLVRPIKRAYSSRREKNYDDSFDDYEGIMKTSRYNAI